MEICFVVRGAEDKRAERRMMSSRSSVGRGGLAGAAGLVFEAVVVVVGEISSVLREDFMSCDFVSRICAVLKAYMLLVFVWWNWDEVLL